MKGRGWERGEGRRNEREKGGRQLRRGGEREGEGEGRGGHDGVEGGEVRERRKGDNLVSADVLAGVCRQLSSQGIS
eukprot:747676-Hanusia_phi.AAC.2